MNNSASIKLLRERLEKIGGWHGLGFWVNTAAGSGEWIGHFADAHAADVTYLKIDGGDRQCDATAAARKLAPGLVVEHAVSRGPLNNPSTTMQSSDPSVYIINHSDTFRTYDVTPELSIPTTLKRFSNALDAFEKSLEAGAVPSIPYPVTDPSTPRRIISCQDEVYLAAGLSAAVGVMRHPMSGVCPAPDHDSQLSGPRDLKHRMDEVARMAMWHRLAPPMGLGTNWPSIKSHVDHNQTLADSWTFRPGDTWLHTIIGKNITQSAPARVSRGIPLPGVVPATASPTGVGGKSKSNSTDVPFVVASRHANGCVAVSTLGRYSDENGYFTPRAHVTIDATTVTTTTTARPAISSTNFTAGVFGHFASLTVQGATVSSTEPPSDPPAPPPSSSSSPSPSPTSSTWQLLAQDLVADTAVDITDHAGVTITPTPGKTDTVTITIDGAVIDTIGTMGASKADISEPGLVLVLMSKQPRTTITHVN
jgi:hypothetical protein